MSDKWNLYHRAINPGTRDWDMKHVCFYDESSCLDHFDALDQAFNAHELTGGWLVTAPGGAYRSYLVERCRGVYTALGHVAEEQGKRFTLNTLPLLPEPDPGEPVVNLDNAVEFLVDAANHTVNGRTRNKLQSALNALGFLLDRDPESGALRARPFGKL